MRTRCHSGPGFCLCVGLAVASGRAAPPALDVAPSGAIRSLAWPGAPPVAIALHIPRPGWDGNVFSQVNWNDARCERAPDGRSWRVRGEASWEGGGVILQETVSVEDSSVRVEYLLRCRGETRAHGVLVMVDTPAPPLAGSGCALIGFPGLALAIRLPEALPDEYHLAQAPKPAWVAWQHGDAVTRLEGPGGWLAAVNVQDNRKFRVDTFQAQLTVADTSLLRDGQEIRFGLRIAPDSAAALAAAGTRRLESTDVRDGARVPLAAAGEPAFGPAAWSAREGPQWQPVEVRFDLTGTWENPFDPVQVDVRAEITGPDGRTRIQPAFVYQDFEQIASPAMEVLTPRGSLDWRVRWTPLAEGTYDVRLKATLQGREVTADAGRFLCRGRAGHGFVRRLPDTPYYLGFDDGTPYVAIGENICWDGQTPAATYRAWFEKLARAGGNYCRIWLVRWNLGLEWSSSDGARRGCFYGLGRYSLDNAWRLDEVLRAAADNGIFVMLCLGYHGELLDKKAYFGEDCWGFNPYNAANGGPCSTPAEFWTSDQARNLYKRRLRYTLARWGAFPAVLSWEFWNEVHAPAPWIAEMARYLAEHDIHGHLRTTTYGGDETWNQELMDYSQTHHYGSDGTLADSGPILAATSMDWTGKYRKPFLMGEFGIDWKSSDRRHDARAVGANLHNGLWASLASRSLGTAAIWYWDDYVDACGLYGHFTPVAEFVRRVRWRGFAPERPATLTLAYVTPRPPSLADVSAPLADEWRRQPDGEVRLGQDGEWLGGVPSAFLFSPSKPDLRAPLRLRLEMPQAGTVRLTVGRVSSSATLKVTVDGNTALTREFRCGPPGQGRYKETTWAEQWGIWQCTFDEEVSLDLAAGSRLVELTNEAGDWMTVPRILITGYRDAALPNVRALVLVDRKQAIGWFQDRASTWQADRDGVALEEIAPLRVAFSGLDDGPCAITWLDTWKGVPLREGKAAAAGGMLTLETPPFRRDVALIVQAAE